MDPFTFHGSSASKSSTLLAVGSRSKGSERYACGSTPFAFALSTSDVLGYVSYNRGFKSGGYNGNDPTNPPYGPEELDAYELGLKSELPDHRMRLNSAVFYYNYQNIQVSRYTDTAVIYNGPGASFSEWTSMPRPGLRIVSS